MVSIARFFFLSNYLQKSLYFYRLKRNEKVDFFEKKQGKYFLYLQTIAKMKLQFFLSQMMR